MKILAIDLGDVHTGLAMCDENESLAAPFLTIVEHNPKVLIKKIAKYVKTLKIETVIVGNPINMNGSNSTRSEKCEKFARNLEQQTKIPTILWDERQTTISAHKIMTTLKTKQKNKKKLVDKIAATIILETYLNFRKNQKLNKFTSF